MKRLILILLCHLSIYIAFAVCNIGNPITDDFDLRRHNGYYLTMLLFCLMVLTPKDKYEDWVTFCIVVFIEGVLINCIIFNCTGDREFHWYSVALIPLSFGHGMKKAWPHIYNAIKECLIDIFIVPVVILFNRFRSWLCRTTK